MACLAFPHPLCAQPPTDTALFTAIRSGDATNLQQQLTAGSDANAVCDGFSALMAATLSGSPQQMQLLLDHGAKVNYTNADSITALWLAVPDSTKTVLLLDHGANPNLLSKEKYTVLVKLVNFPGTTNLFRLLIARGADLKHSARDNMLLYLAASTDDTALVAFLLQSGFHANDTVSYGDYPINSALNFRCFATMKMLVENGANVNSPLPDAVLPLIRGMTPLMIAAVSDDEPSFYYLLDHGADIHAKSRSGYTALMYAQLAETDHPNFTRALLDHGAIPAEKAPDGADALALASKKGNTQSLQLLRQR
jgi:ankyrin repeat protein